MTIRPTWGDVADRPAEILEFGVCHAHYSWRRHRRASHKFKSLSAAFNSPADGILTLLQEVGGNRTSRANAERGIALFACVWYPDQSWAILCDPMRAALVEKCLIESLPASKHRDDAIVERLRFIFADLPAELYRPLDAAFFAGNLDT